MNDDLAVVVMGNVSGQFLAGSVHLEMNSCIAGNKRHSDTVLIIDTQATQLRQTSDHQDSDVFGAGEDDETTSFENPLSGALGLAFERVLSEIKSTKSTMVSEISSVHGKLDEMNDRLRVVEDTVAQMKEGQSLDMGANQQWKTQVANEVAKISQQQDIGESL